MPADVRAVVHGVLGSHGDETILEYVVGVLEDEHYDHGCEGSETYEHLGPILLESGCCGSEAEAREACRQLAARLEAADAADAAAGAAFTAGPAALPRGPVLLADADPRRLLTQELKSGRDLIQTPFGNLPSISERDRAKLDKARAKEAAAARAAAAAHQARAAAALAGKKPTIQRNTGGCAGRDVQLDNFSVSNGGAELIQDANVLLAYGRRYGLIGRNGTGKSTFLRALAGGEIKGVPPGCQVLHVEQEVAGDETPVLQAVLECDVERSELLAEERALMEVLGKDKRDGDAGGDAAAAAGSVSDSLSGLALDDKQQQQKAAAAAAAPDGASKQQQQVSPEAEAAASARLQEVWRRLVDIDADGAQAKAAGILAGLSFDAEMMARPTRSLSGGWRMRVALARALFVEPDLLLLDEPTNHLDLCAVLWLEDFLLRYPKTLLVVSHAREFLNAVCTDVLHLHSRTLTAYRGNYSAFLKASEERMRNAVKAAEAQAAKRAHVQNFIDKFRYNAKRASLVQSRIKALERMAEVSVAERDPEYVFTFPEPDVTGVTPPILGFHDVDFGYRGGPTLFKGLNFGVDLETRCALVGPNGIGKSTLLGLISGALEPTKGHVTRNPKVRMAVFSQHHVDGLDLALSPLQAMLAAHPGLKEPEARAHLGSFGVSGPLALQSMYTLSGGQKSRVALAKLTFTRPHILLLDEPSNHLDADAISALIEGLAVFKGGVLMVSHDQHLIECSVDELWMVEHNTVTPFHGTFEDYKKRLKAQWGSK